MPQDPAALDNLDQIATFKKFTKLIGGMASTTLPDGQYLLMSCECCQQVIPPDSYIWLYAMPTDSVFICMSCKPPPPNALLV
jgi:hypothetical protein